MDCPCLLSPGTLANSPNASRVRPTYTSTNSQPPVPLPRPPQYSPLTRISFFCKGHNVDSIQIILLLEGEKESEVRIGGREVKTLLPASPLMSLEPKSCGNQASRTRYILIVVVTLF